jgi:hypothetical protein
MRRVLLAAALGLGLVGCGSGGGGGSHHDSCSGPGTCTAGNYCALTKDGNVCWPDTVAPSIRDVTVQCSTNPCRRDAALLVTATVEDGSGTGRAWVELDADPGTRWEMSPSPGAGLQVEVPLDRGPFPYFEHDVRPTVHAIDEAENPASTQAGLAVRVTRARWSLPLKTGSALSLSSPAILPDGRVVLGGSDGKLYFVAEDGQSSTSVQVANESFSGPPSVGNDAIWVAGQDGKLHKLGHDGVVIPLVDCGAAAPLLGAPLVDGARALAASTGVEVLVAKASNSCTFSNLLSSGTSPVSMDTGGRVFLGTGGTLRSLSLAANGALSELWTGSDGAPSVPSVGDSVQNAPLPGHGTSVWTVARNGAVNRTASDTAATTTVATISSVSTGGIVLADDSTVVSDALGRVIRLRLGGAEPLPASEQLSGAPQIGLALDGPVPSILVPTSSGDVYLLQASDLSTIWTLKLSILSLQPANVSPNPGNRTSTAYLAGADGKLHAIVVDGVLDPGAPWPKAFHDRRNTSNAGVVP